MPQIGDVVFVRTEGIVSDIIRYFDPGRFNHVATFVSPLEIIEAEYNTPVRRVPFIYKDYEIVPMNYSYEEQQRVFKMAQGTIGEPYDYLQIGDILARKLFHWHWLDKFNTNKAVICSELTAYFLIANHKVPDGSELLAPNELYKVLKGIK